MKIEQSRIEVRFVESEPESRALAPADMVPWVKPLFALRMLVCAVAFMTPVFGIQAGATFVSLYSFSGGDDGSNPQAGLVQGSDGFLYGTTFNGGTNSDGTVFKIGISGALTNLYSFTGGKDGASPQAGLIQGNDGFFYSTTQSGGMPATGDPAGTVFKINSNGALTNLYSFNVDFPGGNAGSFPVAGLVQGNDGFFYGTTLEGGTYAFSGAGTNGYGTVFKISTNGTLNSLYAFSGGADGANPAAGLAQGKDGFLYGTTQSGGTGNSGTVFKINPSATTPDEVFTNLYSFSGGSDGGVPLGGLVQSSDGFLYGTTSSGGTNNSGSVFKIGTNGTLTSLYSFTGNDDGSSPEAGLVQGSDGNFYGTTQSGGTNGGEGTLFKITSKGEFTSLYSFSGGNDGSNPQAPLTQAADGFFYGTTVNGGQSGAGTVFRLAVDLGPPALAITSSAANVILTWPMNPPGYRLQSAENLVSSVWTTDSSAPAIVNGRNIVTNAISGSGLFFRLSR
jgi:uncharacterized repeat protein (TIGR03803 family)